MIDEHGTLDYGTLIKTTPFSSISLPHHRTPVQSADPIDLPQRFDRIENQISELQRVSALIQEKQLEMSQQQQSQGQQLLRLEESWQESWQQHAESGAQSAYYPENMDQFLTMLETVSGDMQELKRDVHSVQGSMQQMESQWDQWEEFIAKMERSYGQPAELARSTGPAGGNDLQDKPQTQSLRGSRRSQPPRESSRRMFGPRITSKEEAELETEVRLLLQGQETAPSLEEIAESPESPAQSLPESDLESFWSALENTEEVISESAAERIEDVIPESAAERIEEVISESAAERIEDVIPESASERIQDVIPESASEREAEPILLEEQAGEQASSSSTGTPAIILAEGSQDPSDEPSDEPPDFWGQEDAGTAEEAIALSADILAADALSDALSDLLLPEQQVGLELEQEPQEIGASAFVNLDYPDSSEAVSAPSPEHWPQEPDDPNDSWEMNLLFGSSALPETVETISQTAAPLDITLSRVEPLPESSAIDLAASQIAQDAAQTAEYYTQDYPEQEITAEISNLLTGISDSSSPASAPLPADEIDLDSDATFELDENWQPNSEANWEAELEAASKADGETTLQSTLERINALTEQVSNNIDKIASQIAEEANMAMESSAASSLENSAEDDTKTAHSNSSQLDSVPSAAPQSATRLDRRQNLTGLTDQALSMLTSSASLPEEAAGIGFSQPAQEPHPEPYLIASQLDFAQNGSAAKAALTPERIELPDKPLEIPAQQPPPKDPQSQFADDLLANDLLTDEQSEVPEVRNVQVEEGIPVLNLPLSTIASNATSATSGTTSQTASDKEKTEWDDFFLDGDEEFRVLLDEEV